MGNPGPGPIWRTGAPTRCQSLGMRRPALARVRRRPSKVKRASRGAWPGWLSPNVSIHGQLGSIDTTAQVPPAAFTVGMMRAAEARGAELRLGRVTGLLRRGEDVMGVDLDGEAIEADAVVIAMGPWSVLAAQWLSLPLVFGLKGHSLVFETGTAIPSEALFLEYTDATGSVLSPEISFPVRMAPRMSVRSRASLLSRLILISSFPTMVR